MRKVVSFLVPNKFKQRLPLILLLNIFKLSAGNRQGVHIPLPPDLDLPGPFQDILTPVIDGDTDIMSVQRAIH